MAVAAHRRSPAHPGAGVPSCRDAPRARRGFFGGETSIFEKSPAGVDYVYGSYVDELLAILPASGVVAERKFVHSNHLYSVAAMTNSAGAVVERYRYDAYGQRQVLAADGTTVRAASSYGNQVGFTGRYLDKETGLWFFRARYYSTTLGRFLNRNPWGYNHRAMMLYDYLSNSPSLGTEPFSFEWLLAGAQIGIDTIRGGADSLTVGLTGLIRESIYGDGGQPVYETAYMVGEYAEVTVEVTVTLGAGLLKQGAKKVTAVRLEVQK